VILLEAFTAALVASIGVWWLRGAVRTWRGVGRFSAHPFFRVQTEQRRENIDRCAPAVAIALLCWALVFVCVIFVPDSSGKDPQPAVDAVLDFVLMLGFFGAAGFAVCAIVIRYFNRPRFLVPPSLRSAPKSH
jgi:hypothetical protein